RDAERAAPQCDETTPRHSLDNNPTLTRRQAELAAACATDARGEAVTEVASWMGRTPLTRTQQQERYGRAAARRPHAPSATTALTGPPHVCKTCRRPISGRIRIGGARRRRLWGGPVIPKPPWGGKRFHASRPLYS